MNTPSEEHAAGAHRSNILIGIGLMLITAFCVSGMQAVIRYVSSDVHPFEITFFRCFFGLLFLVPLFFRFGLEPLRTRRIGMHLIRSGLNVCSMLLIFTALSITPLAKVAALDFSSPLFATLLALLFLGERIRLRRIVALLFGFAGTLVILRPGVIMLDQGAVLVMLAAALWATVLMVIKLLSRTESSLTITFYMALFMTPISALFAVPVWETLSAEQVGWLALVGALGSLNQICIAEAFRRAEMTAVLPVDFTRLVWAALIGYLAFGEVPDGWTWVGGVMIFSASTYIAFRERRVRGDDEGKMKARVHDSVRGEP